MMKFCIRDDDINYFTNPILLNEIYSQVPYVKSNLSITPYCGEIYRKIVEFENCLISNKEKKYYYNNLHPSLSHITYPIYNNKKLINFLINNKTSFEYALHGITHNMNKNGYECMDLVDSDYFTKVKYELEKTLKISLKLFSAPNNSISSSWLDCLYKNNLNLITSYGIKPNEASFSIDSIYSTLKILPQYLLSNKQRRQWCVLKYRKVRTVQSYPISIYSNINDVIREIDYAYENKIFFILAIHSYQFSNKEYKDLFLKICKYVKNIGCEFSFISSIFE
jgi:hypothetical protein